MDPVLPVLKPRSFTRISTIDNHSYELCFTAVFWILYRLLAMNNVNRQSVVSKLQRTTICLFSHT